MTAILSRSEISNESWRATPPPSAAAGEMSAMESRFDASSSGPAIDALAILTSADHILPLARESVAAAHPWTELVAVVCVYAGKGVRLCTRGGRDTYRGPCHGGFRRRRVVVLCQT